MTGQGVRCLVREARQNAGLSQEALARQVQVSRQHMVNVERGNAVPSVVLAIAIARALGVSVETLYPPADA